MPIPLGESTSANCCCPPPGTTAPSLAPFVVSVEGLQGIIDLSGVGAIDISTLGNTIYFSLNANAGMGTVTQVAAAVDAGSAAALSVAGSPINTFGTLTFTVDPALVSIAGLTTAADTGIYTTAANTYATFTLTAVGRTLVGQATQALMRTTGLGATTVGSNYFTLANPGAITFPRQNADNTVTSLSAALFRTAIGLEIGVNVQAFSQDLADFVTHASWAGNDLTLAGALSLGEGINTGTASTFNGGIDIPSGDLTVAENGVVSGNLTVNGNITDATWAADTITATRGGTGQTVYAVGDLLYADTTTSLAKLAAVAVGSVLISQGVGTAPAWGDASNLAITVPTGNTLWVSKTGDNGTAQPDVLNLPYLNIQNAINAAASGDTVVVLPGTYTENVELANGVTLIGLGMPLVNGVLGCFNANTVDVFNMRATQIDIDAGTLVRLHNCRVDASSTVSACIVNTGATAHFWSCELNYTGATVASYALECMGTVRAFGCRIRTTSSLVNSVLVAANTSQLQSCTIISGASAASLFATGAQSIGVLGCYANTAKDADVTLAPNGGYHVDSTIS